MTGCGSVRACLRCRRTKPSVVRPTCVTELITKKHSELHVYYSCCPEASPGVITVMDWGLGLESVLQLDLNFEAHLEHLTKLTPEGHVDWQHFLTTYRSPADTEGLADGRPNDALKAAGVKEDATVAQDNGGVPEGTNGWPVLDMRNPFHVDGADGEDSGLHYLHYGPDDQPPPAPPAVCPPLPPPLTRGRTPPPPPDEREACMRHNPASDNGGTRA